MFPALLQRWRRRARLEAQINRVYPAWRARHGARAVAVPAGAPGISVIMPVYRPRPAWLAEAIESVRAQTCPRWELLIVDDASADAEIDALLGRAAAEDARIHLLRLPARGGISAASNAGLAAASLDYVTFLDHDDTLAPHALAAVAQALADDPAADLAFSDEDQIVEGCFTAPYFKPGWNPDLLLSQNLVCHLAVYRRTLVQQLGGLRSAFDGSQDYDLALRVTATTPRIRHVPDVLYHWRQSAASFSATETAACRDAARRAVQEALGDAAVVESDPALPQWPRLRFKRAAARAVLVHGTAAPPEDADVLVFLSPHLRTVTADWMDTLTAQAMRPGVGAAGARLDGPDGRLLHAGYVLDPQCIAFSPVAQADDNDPGYRGAYRLARTVSAVTLDCLAVRSDVFQSVGGLAQEAGDFAAVDLCLKLAQTGLRTVWAPQARLRYAAAPRSLNAGADWMRGRWTKELQSDRFYNPNLKGLGGTSRPPQTPRRKFMHRQIIDGGSGGGGAPPPGLSS